MPSLYEFTTPVGDVASGDFTTLYNASGLTVPNAGAGSVSGNLNVGGNLTVQGSSLLIGPVALQSTLSLPNYTFPNLDGTTYQVLTTDGSGTLGWSSVQTLPGANYTISASTATGGANLDLVSGVTTDSVKFAGGTNVTVTRTDANTITISSSADDIPDGTANGQVLVWESGAWTANNVVSATTSALLTAEFKSNSTTTAGSFAVRRNTGSTAYGSGTSASFVAQVDSDSQAVATFGSVGFGYDASNPTFGVRTSTNNFSTNTRILGADSAELVINGTNITLNDNLTGAPSSNATITVNRGSSTDATITWDETDDRWELNNDLLATGLQGGNIQIAMGGSPDNQIYIGGDNLLIDTDGSHVVQSNSPIQTSAESMGINSDSTAADSYLYMKGSTEYLKWNNGNTRFELSDQLYISQTEPAAQFERQATTAQTTANEMPNALRLTERVIDAGSNATNNGGTSIIFSRTSGASGGAETLYGLIGSRYYGATNTADLSFQWSSDDFTETTPGVFPNTYQLLRLGSSDAEFFNNSLYIDYTTLGSTQVGINTDTPSYTLDVNGDGRLSGDIRIDGNEIKSSTNTTAILLDNNSIVVQGDITVNGQEIKSNGGTTAITLNGNSVDVAGDLTVGDDLTVNGNDLVTTQTTFNLLDTTATTINFGGAATAITIGAPTGTTTVDNNLTVNGSADVEQVTIDGIATINTQTITTTSTATTAISATTRPSQRAMIRIVDNVTGEIHMLEALAFLKGTTAYLTTYAEMYSNAALATFTADVSSGIRILATPLSSNSTTFTVVRTSLT